MVKLFARYVSVGVINTALHWTVFLIINSAGLSQALSNIVAFITAVTFSFFANARFTFKGQTTSGRFLIYTSFMGVMAAAVGKTGDFLQLPPVITLVAFSAISLVMGFFWSKYIVFR
ncbi:MULTISPECIES: GtrA family protein [unclassified Erwinia]|uniref:GtrA family protein n=1 Tax=unclassified Erwinia TaxID=2622719 RepID=UPI0030AFEBDF